MGDQPLRRQPSRQMVMDNDDISDNEPMIPASELPPIKVALPPPEMDDEDDEEPLLSPLLVKPQAKPVKAEPPATPVKRSISRTDSSVKKEPKTPTKAATRKRKHVLTEEHFEPVNTWWDKPMKGKEDPQWRYLEHHGLMFYPPYQPHKIPMIYNGHQIELPPQSEEVANFWCAAQTSDYPEKSRFVSNFWTAFLSTFPPEHGLLNGGYDTPAEDAIPSPESSSLTPEANANVAALTSSGSRKRSRTEWSLPEFEKADFSGIREFLEHQKVKDKETRKAMTKETREAERIKRLKVEGPHMYALHDWIREKVASYKAEVPGLFRGRGEHPKMGKLKRRIFPDEVILNLSENAPVPQLPDWLQGHSWQDVYHDPSVTWLALYRDTVNNQPKYVFLGASSAVKGIKDFLKYELARRLKSHILAIRKDYRARMQSDDICEKQLGTATYVIDALALRVGNEKDREEEADTVGCCSLRVEHVTAFDDEKCQITLDFLGKDSIRYLNTVTLDPMAYRNLKSFCAGKRQDENIFDTTSPGALNRYLRDLMPGLSAKVFRTYNASITLQGELGKISDIDHNVDKSNVEDCKRFYEHANRQVAILCNHQRSVPKQHDASMEKLQKQLTWLCEDIRELEAYAAHLKKGNKKEFTFATEPRGVDDPPRVSTVKANMKEDQVSKRLLQLTTKRVNQELRIRVKDENKTVSNHTSKQHYMDPRITVTFCKQLDLPIEKFFNMSLLRKFPWAMYAKSDFVW